MFFDDCNLQDKDALKKRYHFWAKRLHSDKDGDETLFVKMKDEYDFVVKNGKLPTQAAQEDKTPTNDLVDTLCDSLVKLGLSAVNQITKELNNLNK